MLFDPETVKKVLGNIQIKGVLHVGAHDCEEMCFYKEHLGVSADNVYWIEAIPFKVEECKQKGFVNVFQAVISDHDDQEITFNISNNIQSSSLLEFNTHAIEHPGVYYTQKFVSTSITLDTFFKRNKIDPSQLNFWNLDIQGCELMALKGGISNIQYADVIYLEVNEKELYKECALIHEIDEFLGNHGFQRILTNMTVHGWGDAIYTRRET